MTVGTAHLADRDLFFDGRPRCVAAGHSGDVGALLSAVVEFQNPWIGFAAIHAGVRQQVGRFQELVPQPDPAPVLPLGPWVPAGITLPDDRPAGAAVGLPPVTAAPVEIRERLVELAPQALLARGGFRDDGNPPLICKWRQLVWASFFAFRFFSFIIAYKYIWI